MSCQEKTYPSSRGDIAAKIWNSGAPKRAIALHGWLDNAASFDGLAPLLPDLEIVAIDLPGHGFSFHRNANEAYPFAEWISCLREAFDALGWERAIWMGHSLGGAIASFYAALFPEHVEKLWLLESMGPLALTAEEAPERMKKYLEEQQKMRVAKTPVYRSVEDVVKLRRAVTSLLSTSAYTLMERSLKPVEGGYTWRSDPALRLSTPVRMVPEQIHAYMRRIQAPTLLVRAENGIEYDRLDAKARIEAVANLKVITIPGGHHVHLDHPERVAEVLKNELRTA